MTSSRSKISAGLLLCRQRAQAEFLLVHPGGPFFAGKEEGVWSIPKGLLEPGEVALLAALREFVEETGFIAPAAHCCVELGEATQKSGKRVIGFAALGDADPSALRSNSFELEWPPHSGLRRSFPEVDRAAWLTLGAASKLIIPAQLVLLERARMRMG